MRTHALHMDVHEIVRDITNAKLKENGSDDTRHKQIGQFRDSTLSSERL